jgi:molybdopterin-containing oxidoreductase family iron-sulfur binding subunit
MMRRSANGPLEPVTWQVALQRFTQMLGDVRGRGQAANAAFINRSESGSFPAFLDQWLAGLGMPAHYAYDPESPDAVVAANRQAYGAAWPALDFKAARLVVSFGADFLDNWGPTVPMQLDWADARAQLENAPRFVYVGPRRSLTGLNADQWIACRPGTELAILNAIRGTGSVADAAQASGVSEQEITNLRAELQSARPSMVLAGGWQANGTELALAAAAFNQSLGNVGVTIKPQQGLAAFDRTDSFASFRELVDRMNAGSVSMLMLRNADLAHDLPQGLGVAAAIRKVPNKVAFSTFPDQTTELCDLILPDHHSLESWGDAEPVRGTISLQQPTMDPVFDTRQTADVLMLVGTGTAAPAERAGPTQNYRAFITQRFPGGPTGLATALARGIASGSTLASTAPARTVANKRVVAPSTQSGDMFLVVYPSSVLGFGAGANKPWLQELPDPVTKIAWQSVAELHPMTAKRLGVDNGDLVTVRTSAGSLTLPVYIYMGVRPDVVAVMAGRGHAGDNREYYDARKLHLTGYGRYADGVGGNPKVLVPPFACQNVRNAPESECPLVGK